VTEPADQDHDRKGRATGCYKRGECSREKREHSQHLGKVLIFAFSPYQLFWAAMARREFITDDTVAASTYRKQAPGVVGRGGCGTPRRGRSIKGRCLTLVQREEIA
jgi:hypothetical protein